MQSEHTCPNCQSKNSEGVKLAYLKGVRESHHSVTKSLFAQSLGRPEPKDILFTPMFVAVVLFFISIFCWPDEWAVSRFSIESFIACTLISMVTCLSIALPRVYHNATVFAEELAHWERRRVCRDCGCVFGADS